jgi:copper chaperone NosL
MMSALHCLIVLCLVAVSFAGEPAGPSSSPKEKCSVCGMFISPFVDWNARIEFDDSAKAVMCGPKGMFKYYLDMMKYNPSMSRKKVTAIYVKDYYTKTSIEARKAFFVIWSDVYGPMGHEPIPFEKRADAKRLLEEHNGRKILRFRDITPKVILSLDNP